MNKKNKRIREQVADFLIGRFKYSEVWVREIDIEQKEGDLLSQKEKVSIREIILDKLKTQAWINLRLPVVSFHNTRLNKNLPGILVDLKTNGPTLDIKWKIADKFGNHDLANMYVIADQLVIINEFFEQLKVYLNLNYNQEPFKKEQVR